MLIETLKHAARMVARTMKLAIFASVFVVAAGSLNSSRERTVLENVLASGELHIASRNGPTTYYEGPNGLVGFEYSLAKRFAKKLGVTLIIHDEEDLGVMLNRVTDEQVHFAAAGLSVTNKRSQTVKFSTSYLDVQQQLIYRSGQERPKSIDDIIGKKIVVISNSSHTEQLRALQRDYPELTWEERSDVEMLDLLEMVHSGEIDHAIVDSNAYDLSESLYPKARVAFTIKEPEQLAWAWPQQRDSSLFNEAERFFANKKTQGYIADAIDTYYGHLGKLDYSGAILFAHRLDSRLPKWEEKLKQAADKYELDWQLLAALSYQESHWNPKAKSPTGVRGFMMLTLNTAKEMGIKNRLNPDQSILGGAKYYHSLHKRIPERIEAPDRLWLALAAYNVGMGHVNDARILTERHGGNPDKWADVQENLLLLSKRKYYKSTKHGYARGWEAVEYVQNIRNFHTIIAWNEKQKMEHIALKGLSEQRFAQFSPAVAEAVKSLAVSTL